MGFRKLVGVCSFRCSWLEDVGSFSLSLSLSLSFFLSLSLSLSLSPPLSASVCSRLGIESKRSPSRLPSAFAGRTSAETVRRFFY